MLARPCGDRARNEDVGKPARHALGCSTSLRMSVSSSPSIAASSALAAAMGHLGHLATKLTENGVHRGDRCARDDANAFLDVILVSSPARGISPIAASTCAAPIVGCPAREFRRPE